MENKADIEKILESARWAPSGDNMQTWRFEIIDDKHFVIHAFDTREHCVYDLQGRASQLAVGALMESIAIAASQFGLSVKFTLRENGVEEKPIIDVLLIKNAAVVADPLFSYLPLRSVQRRAFKTTPLTEEQKAELKTAVGSRYRIQWVEGWGDRFRAALMMFKNGKLRLTLPEAYATHSTVIDWGVRYSKDKIPDKAIGLDPIATLFMKWTIKSWKRVRFFNKYLAGTLLPGIELDLMPGIRCAAHFVLLAEKQPETVEDYMSAGRAVQRFWLTATQLGLKLQPEMTPLIFSGYVKNKVKFTENKVSQADAEEITRLFDSFLKGNTVEDAVFIGRVGRAEDAYARSVRLSVNELLVEQGSK